MYQWAKLPILVLFALFSLSPCLSAEVSLEKVKKRAMELEEQGENIELLKKVLEYHGKLVQSGKTDEARTLVQRTWEIVSMSKTERAKVSRRFTRKTKLVEKQIGAWDRSGGDTKWIKTAFRHYQGLVLQMKIKEAEEVLDRLVKIVQTPPYELATFGKRFKRKMTQVQRKVARWQREGYPLTALAGLKKDLEKAFREGRIYEAEKVLDRALKVLNKPNTADKGIMARLKKKGELAKKLAAQWVSEDRDLTYLKDYGPRVKRLIAQGKLKEAEALVDRALKILSTSREKSQKYAEKLVAKTQQINERLNQWMKEGRDTSEIDRLMKRFAAVMDGGDLEKADAILDEVLRRLTPRPR